MRQVFHIGVDRRSRRITAMITAGNIHTVHAYNYTSVYIRRDSTTSSRQVCCCRHALVRATSWTGRTLFLLLTILLPLFLFVLIASSIRLSTRKSHAHPQSIRTDRDPAYSHTNRPVCLFIIVSDSAFSCVMYIYITITHDVSVYTSSSLLSNRNPRLEGSPLLCVPLQGDARAIGIASLAQYDGLTPAIGVPTTAGKCLHSVEYGS